MLLGREPGVVSAKQKVEHGGITSIAGHGSLGQKSLTHTYGEVAASAGWWVRMEWMGELVVMTKASEKDGITKYFVNRLSIHLDLLTLVNFTGRPAQRGGERHNTTDTPSPLTSSNSTGASGLSSSTSTSGAGTSAIPI
ncbi:hypothetical protein DFJ43DRAFT_1155244 [Lentinula guzmanii]|uniref:Uncharacterized protein n=1 Tax=Lentinula guzmanii TaxID=2804957 RepID=A0AA38MTE2_9AGAR|nr:hypothetical protein DFJ43DRAFT_1155244 [Lentinula guzmanii]